MGAEKIKRQASLLNRTEFKRRILQYAKDTRAHPFKRVSNRTVAEHEAMAEARLRHHVQSLPSKGMTI